jgi:hypothetical protein
MMGGAPLSDLCLGFLLRILQDGLNEENRPDLEELLLHPWFATSGNSSGEFSACQHLHASLRNIHIT